MLKFALLALLAWVPSAALARDAATSSLRDALWLIVHGQCVPHAQADKGAAPCASIDLKDGVDRGYVVLKDIRGRSHYLVIPTAKITGIEDPAILKPDARNFWEGAWEARNFTEKAVGKTLPRDAFGLAINSVDARSQDQLHIHVDCLKSDVRKDAASLWKDAGKDWSDSKYELAGTQFRIRKLEGDKLDAANPFKLLGDDLGSEPGAMGHHTLVVLPGRESGFLLLDAKTVSGHRAHGEDVLDRDCRIASEP